MTLVAGERATVYLYRHCDGYPAEAGTTLYAALGTEAAPASFDAAVRHLLAGADGSRYELADWKPEHQGDLEHVYEARHRKSGGWSVLHWSRPRGAWDPAHDNYRAWPCAVLDLSGLCILVNRDRREMNARMAVLRAQNPGNAHYSGEYPMLGIEVSS